MQIESLTKLQAEGILEKVRLETLHRCQIAISASLFCREKGFMVSANIAGKPILFRNLQEFITYCENIPSHSMSSAYTPGITQKKLMARVNFIQEILEKTTKAHFMFSSTKFRGSGNEIMHRGIKYYVKDSGKCKVFDDLGKLKAYLMRVLETAQAKEPNPVKKAHLRQYAKAIRDGVDSH